MTSVTTWEGEQITLPSTVDSRTIIYQLLKISDNTSSKAFRLKKGKLHAGEVVGCVRIGNFQLNILPKTDKSEINRDCDFLLNIIQKAGYLGKTYSTSARVRKIGQNPLEAIITELANDVRSSMINGIPRRYEQKTENLTSLRGRIDFAKLSTRSSGADVSLPVTYSPLHQNNELARCIKAICLIGFRLSRTSSNRQFFSTIIAKMQSVERVGDPYNSLKKLRLSKLESHWQRTISIGILLLGGHAPDPTFSGENQAFSLLFSIQHLYEKALRGILPETLGGTNVKINKNTNTHFLLKDQNSEKNLIRLKPDFIFSCDAGPIALGDAKWKRAQASQRAYGIDREDFYQMATYLSVYNVKDLIIFLPTADWMTTTWSSSYLLPHTNAKIHLIGVDIESLVSSKKSTRITAIENLATNLQRIITNSDSPLISI